MERADDRMLADKAARVARVASICRWCILRTSGPRTLTLASALNAIGIEAWTPKRTFKRPKPGKVRDANGKRITVEVDAAILPTFVFAQEVSLPRLQVLANDPASTLPGFSVFRHGGRFPLVSDADVSGLRLAEEEANTLLRELREAETREEADRLRIAALRTEQARMKALRMAEAERRKALRAEARDFVNGQAVVVEDMPALIGVTGIVQNSDGRTAWVKFGGTLTMKIEAWRLSHDSVQVPQS
jgi:hypothetical protein